MTKRACYGLLSELIIKMYANHLKSQIFGSSSDGVMYNQSRVSELNHLKPQVFGSGIDGMDHQDVRSVFSEPNHLIPQVLGSGSDSLLTFTPILLVASYLP
jgi:hypothetical protein